ncbi:hypothetical protein CDN98_19650 [Roseateles terrae]|nr:hypothetical protein CDN98_19650 [Roseateles terrae]
MLVIGLCAGAASGVALAQSSGPTTAPQSAHAAALSFETRVLAVCPGVETQLAEALGPAQARNGAQGNAVVTFRLNGKVIDDVVQVAGPQIYRSELRRAVRHLQCDNGQDSKTYALQVSFMDADGSAPTKHLTLAAITPLSGVDAAALRRSRTAD